MRLDIIKKGANMPEVMNGEEMIQAAAEQERRTLENDLSYLSPDSFRNQMNFYRLTLEGKGLEPSENNSELIKQIAYENSKGTLNN